MKKKVRIIKRNIAIFLIIAMSINSFGAIVSDNDGSAFITKAEFDALKSNFQSQIDTYNTSIDSKIDGAIASYLAGIKIANDPYSIKSCLTVHRDKKSNVGVILFVGSDNGIWYWAGDSVYAGEMGKGKFNMVPALQMEVWYNVTYSDFDKPDNHANSFPPALKGNVSFFLHFKSQETPAWASDGSGAQSSFIILDDAGRVKNWRANGRVQLSRLWDQYCEVTATNWQPQALHVWDDGTVGTLYLQQIPKEMFTGQNTHNNDKYLSWGAMADQESLQFGAARWGSNASFPEQARIKNPVDGSDQIIGYVDWSNSGYKSWGTYYQYFKTSWTASLNTEYGDGFGVYVPSAMKTSTKTIVVDNWPATNLLSQENHAKWAIGEATDGKIDGPDATNWNILTNTVRQMTGGISAHLATASYIPTKANLAGYVANMKEEQFKELRTLNDSYIYDEFREECAIGGCPVLSEAMPNNGKLQWNNIIFSNGHTDVTAGNFDVRFKKTPFEESNINAAGQVVITDPKPFKYKTHSSSTWSSEVTSLQPTKGTGYDFLFEVEKNEKIYFGVFDKSNINEQGIVVREPDDDALMFIPSAD